MFDEALRRAIAPFGSISRFAKKLGLRRENVSSWLNRNVRISLEHALKIDRLTDGSVSWEELVSPHIARLLKACVFKSQQIPFSFESVYVSIARIRSPHCFNNRAISEEEMSLAMDIKAHGLQRPVCVDMENALIFGQKRIHAYQILGKKTIPAWRISLDDLMIGKYSETRLGEIFTLSERVSIGLSVEKFLGNRQGRPKNNLNRENFPEFKGRTDEFFSESFGFWKSQKLSASKKICQSGCQELIESLDQQQIAISSAALLAQLPQNKQKQILTSSSKEIASHINRLRRERLSHRMTNHLKHKEA